MNRRLFLQSISGAAFAAALAPSHAHGADPLALETLTDDLTMLAGGGGNIAILKSGDGLLLVDTGVPEAGEGIAGKVHSLGPKVATVINTHWHYDHVSGNERFAKEGARIIAHENVKRRLSTKQHIAFMNMDAEPLPEAARPGTTFGSQGTMKFGSESVKYVHLPPAHTDGDTAIHFQHANVLHCGDLFFRGFYPFIDYSTGGNIEGMAANAERLGKMADGKTRIIPGHGPVGTKADLDAYHHMLADLSARITKLIKEGKSLEETQAANPTKAYDAQWGQGFLKPAEFVRMIYQGKASQHT